jgi:predicted DNA-binding transcriptional regulator AlpA
MQSKQDKHYKDHIRVKARREVILAENTGTPWLTLEEAAARVGLSPHTLRDWVSEGWIPKPLKWLRRPVKKKFRRAYVETMLQLMIIRASTNLYRSEQSVRNLMWTPLFGLR